MRCLPHFSRRRLHISAIIVVLLFSVGIGSGCGGESGSSYPIGGLLGARSTFEATAEGAVDGALEGSAEFRTDDEDQLIGIELVHAADTMRGISIVLEPYTLDERTYEVIDSGLLGVERPGGRAGFTAFFAHGEHSFQATRGTLRVTQADASLVYGTFDLRMSGRPEGGSLADGDVSVHGTFQATRPE